MAAVKQETDELHELSVEQLLERFQTKLAAPVLQKLRNLPAQEQRPALDDETEANVYAVMPPLEHFMGVTADARRKQFYKASVASASRQLTNHVHSR